ncbi:hypothetical protein [Pseudoalteromonas umbrosa]|nr:hypothetical protein [Pseudoalteromonas sp. B95]MDK1289812.1 hypothetical protein [Pseudoalteromonas sp. B95]
MKQLKTDLLTLVRGGVGGGGGDDGNPKPKRLASIDGTFKVIHGDKP